MCSNDSSWPMTLQWALRPGLGHACAPPSSSPACLKSPQWILEVTSKCSPLPASSLHACCLILMIISIATQPRDYGCRLQSTAKVADMGLARVLTGSSLLSRGSRGTYHWAAPELLLGRRVTMKADIWSFGVVSTCRYMLLRLHWLVSVMPDCCCTAIVIPRCMFGVQAAVSDSRCIAAVARLML